MRTFLLMLAAVILATATQTETSKPQNSETSKPQSSETSKPQNSETSKPQSSVWRAATETELKEVIPARAPVEKERIETEFRTASGITDGKGKFVAGVVLITAGYSAEGKYSHFFLTQVPIKVGDISLKPGEYVFGWRRNADSLTVTFYEAETGKLIGNLEALRNSRVGRIESFQVQPPSEKPVIQIGRFGFNYKLSEPASDSN